MLNIDDYPENFAETVEFLILLITIGIPPVLAGLQSCRHAAGA
jgi:hypothetical protein